MRFKIFLSTFFVLHTNGDVAAISEKIEKINGNDALESLPNPLEESFMASAKESLMGQLENINVDGIMTKLNDLSEDRQFLTDDEIDKETQRILDMVGDNPELRNTLAESSDEIMGRMRQLHLNKPHKRIIGILLAPIKAALIALKIAITNLVKIMVKLAKRALKLARKLMRKLAKQLNRAKGIARNALARTKNVMNKMKSKVIKAARGAKNYVRSAKNRMMDGVKRVVKIMRKLAAKGKAFVQKQARAAKRTVKRAIDKVKKKIKVLQKKFKAAQRKAVRTVKTIKEKVTRGAGTIKRSVIRAYKLGVNYIKKAIDMAKRAVNGVIRSAKKQIKTMKRGVRTIMKQAKKKVKVIKKAVGGATTYATAQISAVIAVIGSVGGAIMTLGSANATSGLTSGITDQMEGKSDPVISSNNETEETQPVGFIPKRKCSDAGEIV